MDQATGKRIIALKDKITESFSDGNWEEVGLLTGTLDIIKGHYRLLRSLSWRDDDYPGNVLEVLQEIYERKPSLLDEIEVYINQHFPEDAYFISSQEMEKKITFSPNVFQIPDEKVEPDLVAVMMPFQSGFNSVYTAIKTACKNSKFRCLRADDIWESSVIIQDIFNLIFRANIVVVDFTDKNPNVMYETGIAHTLGRHVVPISQSLNDVPFDMKHHRVLQYLPNAEGLAALTDHLSMRLGHFASDISFNDMQPGDDDIPF